MRLIFGLMEDLPGYLYQHELVALLVLLKLMAMVCKHCPPHGQHTWRLSARHGQTTGREWRRVLCKWPVQWQASGAKCYAVPHRQLGALRPSQAQAVQASSLVAQPGHLPCGSQAAQEL